MKSNLHLKNTTLAIKNRLRWRGKGKNKRKQGDQIGCFCSSILLHVVHENLWWFGDKSGGNGGGEKSIYRVYEYVLAPKSIGLSIGLPLVTRWMVVFIFIENWKFRR